jgi:hypothetical protein
LSKCVEFTDYNIVLLNFRWFSTHKSSPLNGLQLHSKAVTQNFNLRGQIMEWLDAAAVEGDTSVLSDEDNIVSFTVTLLWNLSSELGAATASDTDREGTRLKELQLTMLSTQTISDLRRLVLQRTRGEFHSQTILHKGRACKGHLTLAQARIGSGATVPCRQESSSGGSVRVIFKRHAKDRSPIQMLVNRSERAEKVMWQLWRDHRILKPGSTEFWINIQPSGDGYVCGNIIAGKEKLSKHASAAPEGEEYEVLEVLLGEKELKKKYRSRNLTRLQAVQQLFHAYTNRTEGYALPNRLGLITFGESTKVACELTGLYSKFKATVDKCKANGDTPLYDAVLMAIEKLATFTSSNESYASCRMRVLVLTDGEDSSSTSSLELCMTEVVKAGIVVDSICIGSSEGRGMKQISAASGGYHFHPDTLKKGDLFYF